MTPEGFTILKRPFRGKFRKPGMFARCNGHSLTFSGTQAEIVKGKFDVAINGTSFAIHLHEGGSFSTTIKQITAMTIVRAIPNGRYVGRQEGDWWVFDPVETP